MPIRTEMRAADTLDGKPQSAHPVAMRHRRHLLALFSILAAPVAWAQAHETDTYVMSGWIGSTRIGLTATVEDHARVVAAHYYFAADPRDIPLAVSIDGPRVVLTGSDGAIFVLKLSAYGQTADDLSFYTSTGLEGSWTRGGIRYPATLSMHTGYSGAGHPPGTAT